MSKSNLPKYDERSPHPKTGERKICPFGKCEGYPMVRQADGYWKVIDEPEKLTKSQKKNRKRRMKK